MDNNECEYERAPLLCYQICMIIAIRSIRFVWQGNAHVQAAVCIKVMLRAEIDLLYRYGTHT